MALALYRKYRPATFAEVVGQEHVTDPLRTALAAGRINHAYLFSGPRGCGKTSSARILARSLNCEQGPTPDPCGECDSCIALAPEGPGSLDVVELDAASHGGVDDTRELRDRAFYMPSQSRYRVFIIDEAHMVSTQGFNALLKIVEEPPEHLVFIFATTEPDKVLTTIRSRTHHYPFRLIPPATLRSLLERLCAEEGVTVDPAVFPLVIRAGGGSARDSLSVLDQLLAGAGPDGVTYANAVSLLGVTDAALLDEMVDALAAGDGASVFGAVDKVVEAGHDPRRFAADLLQRLRDLLVLNAVPDAAEKGLIDVPEDELNAMRAEADRLGSASLSRMADVVHTGLVDMRGTTSPRLVLELMCGRMLLPGASTADSALLQRLERMERRMSIAGEPTDGADDGRENGGGRQFARRSQPGSDGPAPADAQQRQDAGAPPPARAAAADQPPATQPGAAQPSAVQRSPEQPPAEPAPAAGTTAARASAAEPAPPPESSRPEPRRPESPRPESSTGRPESPAEPPSQPAAGQRSADRPRAAPRSTLGLPPPPTLSSDRGSDPAPARPAPDAPEATGAAAPGGDTGPERGARPLQQPATGDRRSTPAAAQPDQAQDDRGQDGQAQDGPASNDQPKGAERSGTRDVSDVGVTDVRKVWSEILSAVQRRRRTTQILLESATVLGVDSGALQLSMPTSGMAKRVVESANADLLRAALREVLGVDWVIRCTAGEAPEGTPRSAPERSSRPVAEPRAAAPPETDQGPDRSPDRASAASDSGPAGGADPTRTSRPDDRSDSRDPGQDRPRYQRSEGRPAPAGDDIPDPEPPPEDDDIPDDYGDPDFMASSTPHDPEQAAIDLLATELGAKRLDPEA